MEEEKDLGIICTNVIIVLYHYITFEFPVVIEL